MSEKRLPGVITHTRRESLPFASHDEILKILPPKNHR